MVDVPQQFFAHLEHAAVVLPDRSVVAAHGRVVVIVAGIDDGAAAAAAWHIGCAAAAAAAVPLAPLAD